MESSEGKSCLTIIWKDPDKEPLKVFVDEYEIGPFVRVALPEDLRRPGIEHKELCFNADMIDSVEIEEGEFQETKGYREESHFRESPEKSPHFKGMGTPP